MKTYTQFIKENYQSILEYSWDIDFFDVSINEWAEGYTPTGTIVNAKDHPMYKERTEPDLNSKGQSQTVSDEDFKKAMDHYQKTYPADAAKEKVPLKNGMIVGGRLNLNATKEARKIVPNASIATVHAGTKAGKKQTNSYQRGSTLAGNPVLANAPHLTFKNAFFNVNQTQRSYVANKAQGIDAPVNQIKDKNPLASVDGEYSNEKPNYSGVKAKFNPATGHCFTVEDEHGNKHAVKSAEEATCIGDDCYLRGNIEFHTAESLPKKLGKSTSDTQVRPAN